MFKMELIGAWQNWFTVTLMLLITLLAFHIVFNKPSPEKN